MTTAEVKEMEYLVDWRLKRWRNRGDYDDMRQEALIAAWKAVEKTRGGAAQMSTIVVKATDWAAREWLRSAHSDLPHYGWRRPYAPLPLVSLQALSEQRQQYGEVSGDWGQDREPTDDDFAPALVERLSAREEWVQAVGSATPRQAAALRAIYREGKTQQQIARETGRHFSAISQLHARALARCRAPRGVEKEPDENQ